MALSAVTVFSAPKEIFITIGTDALNVSQKSVASQKLMSNDQVTVLKINEDMVPTLSTLMHDEFNRCGGFIVHVCKPTINLNNPFPLQKKYTNNRTCKR